MIEEKLTIESLTSSNVSILTQKFYNDNGVLTQLGQNYRVGYTNSASGRTELSKLPQNVQNSILAIWGTTPTILDSQKI